MENIQRAESPLFFNPLIFYEQRGLLSPCDKPHHVRLHIGLARSAVPAEYSEYRLGQRSPPGHWRSIPSEVGISTRFIRERASASLGSWILGGSGSLCLLQAPAQPRCAAKVPPAKALTLRSGLKTEPYCLRISKSPLFDCTGRGSSCLALWPRIMRPGKTSTCALMSPSKANSPGNARTRPCLIG